MAYVYRNSEYETVEELNSAITATKNILDNNPTHWCVVKLLSGNAEDGWVIPSETLTDEEINNMSADNYYNVSAIYDGYTYTGINGTDATQRVRDLRTSFANWVEVNTFYQKFVPTNENMSGYVE